MRMRYARLLLVLGLAFFGLSASLPAAAATQPANDLRTPINTEVPIPIAPNLTPGSTPERVADYLVAGRVEDLAQYIGIIYNFLISMVGMVASVMMVIGGFQYLTSAGDSGKIGAAKSRMANALIGMVLALGAYTILNTINPQLLKLKLPDMRAVTTEIFTLPNCEDITVPVTPYGDGTSCGFAGKFMQGNSEQVCIYGGDCRIQDIGDKFGFRTCLQRGGIETSKVKAELAKNRNATFAECLSCGSLTVAKARDLGFAGLDTSCEAFQRAFDLVPSALKTYKRKGKNGTEYTVQDGLFFSCYPKVHHDGCFGIPLYCWDITRDDDTTGGNEGWVANGCEGYDENPDPVYGTDLDSNGYATKLTKVSDCGGGVTSAGCAGLEGFPVHLATVCANNPCQDYKDPDENIQPFINGCKSGSGVFNRVQRIVRFGDLSGINDCRCMVNGCRP